jgi:hypothetical protein
VVVVMAYDRADRMSAALVARGIVPASHLYRHFDSAGKLLYVGISNEVLGRTKDHVKGARTFA